MISKLLFSHHPCVRLRLPAIVLAGRAPVCSTTGARHHLGNPELSGRQRGKMISGLAGWGWGGGRSGGGGGGGFFTTGALALASL